MGFFKAIAITLFLGLAACSDSSSVAPTITENESLQYRPADAQLASIYDRSCRSCHTLATTGAPLAGDKAAWAPRMAMGLKAMVNSVIAGSGGMPPLGLCMDCDVEQFEALILFMAAEGETQ